MDEPRFAAPDLEVATFSDFCLILPVFAGLVVVIVVAAAEDIFLKQEEFKIKT